MSTPDVAAREIDGVDAGAAVEGVVAEHGARIENIAAAAAVEDDAVGADQPARIDDVGVIAGAALDRDGRGREPGAAERAGDNDHVGARAGIDDDIVDIARRDLVIRVRRQHRRRDDVLPLSILMPTWSASVLAGGKKTLIWLTLKVSAALEPVTFITSSPAPPRASALPPAARK